MVLAVLLLAAAGYLSYLNLSSIVSSIRVDVTPDRRFMIIRDISMDLEKAENSIRIYSVTSNNQDLKPYYTIISNIDEKVNRLRAECLNDSVLLEQTEKISRLIEENIVNWNELLILNRHYKVIDYLKQLTDKLVDASVVEQRVEKGILRRVFSRSSTSLLDEQALIYDLDSLAQQDQIIKEQLRARESQLARTGGEIREQFYDLISKMENEISGIIEAKAADADLLAGKTYRWLALFTILGTLLAIAVVFIIISYARRSAAYQAALERSKSEAENLARTKEMFVANMSHEIRTPVTAISGFTEQLLHEPLDENITSKLKIIKSSSDHLSRIINDILDLSKLQDEKMELEKVHFSIGQILADVYSFFDNTARKNNTVLSYSLEPGTPPVLLGDPYRLKQIIINLVSNSVKFTTGGNVRFAVRGIRKEADEIDLVMEFVDTGIGIDEHKIDYIFEDFTQEEMSTARRYGGTGLGLSIVKKLVELQNGTIECKSRKNEGTMITCVIPFLIGDKEKIRMETGPALVIPGFVRNLNVLIVDDEEYNRLLFKVILNRWKTESDEASSGAEALEKVRSRKYNMLFMDIRMPGIDGVETTRYIREELGIKSSEMPVICISATPVHENWGVYKEAGMNAFLPKPFTEEMLLNTILSVTGASPKEVSGESGDISETSPKETINLDNLYHISGGDKQFVRQMLITFIDTTERGLREMHEAGRSDDWESVADLSHRLLPPCRHIGADELSRLLAGIGESIRSRADTGKAEGLIKESLIVFEKVREQLLNQIKGIGESLSD
jgi:signal transduction histidine kinase/CheY-like chemotaxis protein/HPt (histidine-containing phosphotransfer) domain-containing protein